MAVTEKTAATLQSALQAFQSLRPSITPDAKNTHFGNRYATLDVFESAALPLLAKNGLTWSCTLDDNGRLVGELAHTSGQTKVSYWPLPQGSPQQIGSAITYGRRYLLAAMVGISVDLDDDDGNAAQQAKPARQQPRTVRETNWDEVLDFAAGAISLDELRKLHRRAGVDRAPENVKAAFMELVDLLKAETPPAATSDTSDPGLLP